MAKDSPSRGAHAGRGRATNLALLAVSLIVSVAVAEGLFRWWEQPSRSTVVALDGPSLDLGRLNYNDTVITADRPEGEFRILSFGDSFCYSIMTPAHSYNGRIAENLSGLVEGRSFRVVNLGEAATTVTDYAAAYKFWASKIEHDAALFNIYLGNDILDVAYRSSATEWQPNRVFQDLPYHLADGSPRGPVPRKFPLRMLDHAYALYLQNFKTDTGPAPADLDPRFNLAATHNPSEEKFLEINRDQLAGSDFGQIQRLFDGYRAVEQFLRYVSDLRKEGLPVLVTLAPGEVSVDPELRQRVAETYDLDLSNHGFNLTARVIHQLRDRVDPELELLDLSPAFACATQRGDDLYYQTNTHWGAEGNALAGQLIGAYLAESWFWAEPSEAPCTVETDTQEPRRVSEAEIGRFIDSWIPVVIAPEHLAPGHAFGYLDNAVANADGGVSVWGWAFDPRTDQPPLTVVIAVDGKPMGRRAQVTLERPDVVEAFGKPSMLPSGWSFEVSSTALSPGTHVFEAYAMLSDGKLGKLEIAGTGRMTIDIPAR